MRLLRELLNHRVSYQVLVTFDLQGAESSDYEKLRHELAERLDLEAVIHMSADDGGKEKYLPYNTLATLWRKDDSESATRDHFERKIKEIMKRHRLKGRYLVLVAQNWAVAANEF